MAWVLSGAGRNRYTRQRDVDWALPEFGCHAARGSRLRTPAYAGLRRRIQPAGDKAARHGAKAGAAGARRLSHACLSGSDWFRIVDPRTGARTSDEAGAATGVRTDPIIIPLGL